MLLSETVVTVDGELALESQFSISIQGPETSQEFSVECDTETM